MLKWTTAAKLHTHTYKHTHTHTHTYMYVCVCVYVCPRIYFCAILHKNYIHTYIHPHTPTHIYVCVCVCVRVRSHIIWSGITIFYVSFLITSAIVVAINFYSFFLAIHTIIAISYYILLLYSHIHVHTGCILTQWITDTGRLLYKYIFTSHFIARVRMVIQGLRVRGI